MDIGILISKLEEILSNQAEIQEKLDELADKQEIIGDAVANLGGGPGYSVEYFPEGDE